MAILSSASAETVTIVAVKDNSLYENATGDLSNGSGDYLFAGKTAQLEGFALRRALLAFDVATTVPSGAVIDSALLTLYMSRTPEAGTIVFVHRMLADWGEGSSDALGQEGVGALSAPGDATWIHQFYDTDDWDAPGGDFVMAASSNQVVIGNGFYTWPSNAQMVGDVQMWLDDPASNFGWCLVGVETFIKTIKRFDSRENPIVANRPRLEITYHRPIPAVSTWGITVMALLFATAGTLIGGRGGGTPKMVQYRLET